MNCSYCSYSKCLSSIHVDRGSSSSSKLKETGGSDQGAYKVPEYYQYNEHSYYDIDVDMIKYRLEQPHPGRKY